MEYFVKAWDELNSVPVDVRDLPKSRNGKSSGCKCIACGEELDACQGDINAWFFRRFKGVG